MIYNEDPKDDLVNILDYIDSFSETLGVKNVSVDSKACWEAIIKSRNQFPYVNGIDESSTFKKVSNFVCWFIAKKPIKTIFPDSAVKKLAQYDPNAIIAFDIAIACLEASTIHGLKETLTISKKISVSDHSYYDILDALSTSNILPETHFKIISVFFEQLTYKCNNHCQYETSLYYPDTSNSTGIGGSFGVDD